MPSRKPAGKDLLVGAASSLLAHGLMVVASLLLVRYLQSPLPVPSPFLNVYLVNVENAGAGVSGAGPKGPAGWGMNRDEHSLEEKQTATTAAPATTVVNRRMEPAPVRGKHLKKGNAHPEAKRNARPESPADPGEIAPSPKTVQEDAGGDFSAPRGPSSDTGIGDGPGTSSAGRSLGPGSGSGEFDAASVDQAPKVLVKHEPVYPQKARSLGICGRVVIKFLVEPNGQVSHSGVLEAHPRGYFEQSALETVRRWRFKPGYVKGKAVATWITLPVQFRLVEED